MKFNYPKPKTVNVIVNVSMLLFVILVLATILPFVISSEPTGTTIIFTDSTRSSGVTTFSIDELSEPIDLVIPDSLPYRRYRYLTDSVKQRRMMKDGMQSGGSTSMFVGGLTLDRCEHCSIVDDRQKIREHFIKLSWWVLDTAGMPKPVRYYVKDGKPYLRKVICNPPYSPKNYENYSCKEVDIAVPFRCDYSWNKAMLIPASENMVSILNYASLGVVVLLSLFFLYFIIGGFIKFLLEIARGTPFSETNVQRLKIIALGFLLVPVSLFSLNLLMRLIFDRYFTADIKLSTEAWAFLWKGLVLSAIFGALYFAFRKGKELKEEQDLTV